jgi:hypothetical protein
VPTSILVKQVKYTHTCGVAPKLRVDAEEELLARAHQQRRACISRLASGAIKALIKALIVDAEEELFARAHPQRRACRACILRP